MSIIDSKQMAIVATTLKAARISQDGLPLCTMLTGLMKHGGIHMLLDPEMMTARLAPLLASQPVMSNAAPETVTGVLTLLQSKVSGYFTHLVNEAYEIPYNLMSHIAFPDGGVVHTTKQDEQNDPMGGDSDLPAAFTFVGQFIDHDLTANAVNLFDPQTGQIVDEASPLIDLDNVYGPRAATATPPGLDTAKLFDSKGRFFLEANSHGVIEIPRSHRDNSAFIADKRNDENQLVLQVHMLLMRLHNKLINQNGLTANQAHRETVYTWQSVVLNDYLPRIIDASLIAQKRTAIRTGQYMQLKHAPSQNLATGRLQVSMPHEFAIGFRFGHSQLRPSYKLNGGSPVALFNNALPLATNYADLRGGQPLQQEHVADWSVFLGGKSKLIDSKVTSVVFDLPESTIPDDIKAIGNLPHRNLIRSRQVGLCAGEALADLYGLSAAERIGPNDVEPDSAAQALYTQGEDGAFRTPLWFYILREAEKLGHDGQLGPLGGNLVAEVLLGAIYYNQPSPLSGGAEAPALIVPDDFASVINGTASVTLLELANFVTGPSNDPLVVSDAFQHPEG